MIEEKIDVSLLKEGYCISGTKAIDHHSKKAVPDEWAGGAYDLGTLPRTRPLRTQCRH